MIDDAITADRVLQAIDRTAVDAAEHAARRIRNGPQRQIDVDRARLNLHRRPDMDPANRPSKPLPRVDLVAGHRLEIREVALGLVREPRGHGRRRRSSGDAQGIPFTVLPERYGPGMRAVR